ncbi:MAG: zinc-binding dehydrogenase [Microbacteriaceae bacterium]
MSVVATAMVWHGESAPHEPMSVGAVELAAGEVLVEIELATICGSDVHTTRGDRATPVPTVLGHEQVGRVVALGPEAPTALDGAPIAVGDRIVWSIFAACADCDRCRSGVPQKCRGLRKYGHERIEPRWQLNGGFATHAHLLPGTAIARVGDELPAEVLAPLSCGTATAAAALDAARRAHPQLRGRAVVVSGAGLIGLTLAAMASDAGATVVVVDPSEDRRRQSLRFGAAEAVGTGVAELSEALDTLGFEAPELWFEASGASRAVSAAIAAIDVGGAVVLIGSVSPGPSVAVDPERIVRGLITLTGVHNYAPQHLAAAVAFAQGAAGRHPLAELVGATSALEDLDEALLAAAGGAHVRIGVRPR